MTLRSTLWWTGVVALGAACFAPTLPWGVLLTFVSLGTIAGIAYVDKNSR